MISQTPSVTLQLTKLKQNVKHFTNLLEQRTLPVLPKIQSQCCKFLGQIASARLGGRKGGDFERAGVCKFFGNHGLR